MKTVAAAPPETQTAQAVQTAEAVTIAAVEQAILDRLQAAIPALRDEQVGA